MNQPTPLRRIEFEALESRVLFSASLAPAPAPDGGTDAAAQPVQEQPADPAPAQKEGQTPPLSETPPNVDTPPAETSDIPVSQVVIDGSGSSGGEITEGVQLSQVEAVGQAAAEIWIQSGVNQDQLDLLSQITYSVADFQGSIIGAADGNHIIIDIDAAGAGWFIDTTPLIDEEFFSVENSTRLIGESGDPLSSIDLLTVILHEQGHVLGLPHGVGDSNNVMNDLVPVGERILPLPGQAVGSVPSSGDIEFAATPSNVILDPPSFPTPVEIGETVNIDGTFQNGTVNPITVELLDENNTVIDSTTVAPADNSYSFTVDAIQAGLLKLTVSAYDPTNPTVDYDTVAVDIQVNAPQQPPVNTNTTSQTPAIAPSFPAVDSVPPVTDVNIQVEPPLEIEVGIVVTPPTQSSFLDRFGGTGILSVELYGDEGLFAFDPAQFSSVLPALEVTVYDRENNIIGFQDFVFFGDFSVAGASSILDQLAVNFESMGLARIEITHGRGNAFLDYVAGDFLEASQMTTGPSLFGE